MPYVISRMVLADTPTVEITEAEYKAVSPARDAINQLISVEEKYDAVMENYVELEQTVHSIGIRHLAFVPRDYEEMLAPLNHISRRVSNLLSSARLYRDSLPQHAKKLLGANHATIKPLKASLRDNSQQPMAYREMEAVRNYAQHLGLPISDITFDRHKDFDKDGRTTGFSHSVIPRLDAAEVAKMRDIAADVRAALIGRGETANAMPLIREYIEHIGSIHVSFRQTIKEFEANYERVIRGLLDRYAERTPGEKSIGIVVGFENPDGTISGEEYLVEHRLNYLQYLRIKHLSAVNIALRYVPW
jgi:hypothetical protein